MDDYYCLIRVFNSNMITLYLFKASQQSKKNKLLYPICFSAYSTHLLYRLITTHQIFHNLSLIHIFYISQEVYKAELSIFFNQQYVQS